MAYLHRWETDPPSSWIASPLRHELIFFTIYGQNNIECSLIPRPSPPPDLHSGTQENRRGRNVWWPGSALRCRASAAGPPMFALCPQCFCSLSALFPRHLRTVTALKLSPHTVPAVFPQSFRTVPAAFPHCFRSSSLFCKCLPSTIDI